MKNTKCKILIAYHKPSSLIKSDIYTPIHTGRALVSKRSKDGQLSRKEWNWLNKNMIGDNTGDNISELNRFFNETSAIYWGWKNQDKIGNPAFIGLMHYRRHFIFNEKNTSKQHWLNNAPVYTYKYIDKEYTKLLDEKCLNSLLNQYDIISSHTYDANNLLDDRYYKNCKERFSEVAKVSSVWYEKMEKIIIRNYPQYIPCLTTLSCRPSHYLCNMFVMKKELFDKYCEFAFDVLFELYHEFKQEKFDIEQARAIGFLAEFLTSIFIQTYKNQNPYKVKELDLTYIEHPELRSPFKKLCNFIYSKQKCVPYKYVTILGIKFKFKNKFKELELKFTQQKIEFTQQKIELYNYVNTMLEAIRIHPKTFSKYKNCNQGKNVVLCASGPSIKNFKKIENAIYVGINKSFLNPDLNLNFLFIQDKLEDDIMQKAALYKPDYCKKFYGKISSSRLPDIYPIKSIPMSDVLNAKAFQYILEDNLNYTFTHNIESEPIGDFAGTVFSAMQFILYTHPKRVYLVGCDCSCGYFYNPNSSNDASYQIENWKMIKTFASIYYPDVEIISINPIGLKGIFKDEYQGRIEVLKKEIIQEDVLN